jgi:D-alanine transaminase
MTAPEPFVFLNGRFLPRSSATLDIEDRGALFADGVYEVTRFYGGRPLAMDAHVQRLRRSLAAIDIPAPVCINDLGRLSDELIERNELRDATVYWQITRGVAPRTSRVVDGIEPTVVMIAYPAEPIEQETQHGAGGAARARTAITTEDLRWHRCDIKSLMLLPSVMDQRKAKLAGADVAILHRDGVVTETTSANVMIARGGGLHTHPADQWILNGISRQIVLELARALGVAVHERPFTIDDMVSADEVLVCGTTTHVGPIVTIDGKTIGDGGAGPVARKLNEAFADHVMRECGLCV